MAKEIVVERIALNRVKKIGTSLINNAEFILGAEKTAKRIEERIKRKERGESTPEDNIEVITEWL